MKPSLIAATLAISVLPASAAMVTFDNSSGDSTWETSTNWNTDTAATGSDTIIIPTGFSVTRASTITLSKTSTPPSSLDIKAGASLTITGELQLEGNPAAVNIDGTLIFADGTSRTMSHTVNGGNQGTYTLSGLMHFNDYENGIASYRAATGPPLLDIVTDGATI
jgi:hypothetical protein